MLKHISWSDYLLAVIVLLILYYFFIGVKYFSGEIKALLSGTGRLAFKAALPADSGRYDPDNDSDQSAEKGFEETADDTFAEVEHLIGRLKTVIADASQRKLIREELKQYLRLLLKEYPAIKYSPLRSSINELILSECEKYRAVTLDEDEVELLWKEAV